MDSVKFSGDLVAGLSLLSSRHMYLTPDRDYHAISPDVLQEYLGSASLSSSSDEDTHGCSIKYSNDDAVLSTASNAFPRNETKPFHAQLPSLVTIPLPARSLYILQGIWRYNYAHSVSLPVLQQGEGRVAAKVEEVEGKAEYRRVSVIFRNIQCTYLSLL